MAEWLRRCTRNAMGSPRAGSNPADCGYVFTSLHILKSAFLSYTTTYVLNVQDSFVGEELPTLLKGKLK